MGGRLNNRTSMLLPFRVSASYRVRAEHRMAEGADDLARLLGVSGRGYCAFSPGPESLLVYLGSEDQAQRVRVELGRSPDVARIGQVEVLEDGRYRTHTGITPGERMSLCPDRL